VVLLSEDSGVVDNLSNLPPGFTKSFTLSVATSIPDCPCIRFIGFLDIFLTFKDTKL